MGGVVDSVDMSLSKLWKIVKGWESWCAGIHGVAENGTWLSQWTASFNSINLSTQKFTTLPSFRALWWKHSHAVAVVDWMFVPSPLIHWGLNSQWEGVRRGASGRPWDLDEVVRVGPTYEIHVLRRRKDNQRALSAQWGCDEEGAICSQTPHTPSPRPRDPSLRSCGDRCCCLSPPPAPHPCLRSCCSSLNRPKLVNNSGDHGFQHILWSVMESCSTDSFGNGQRWVLQSREWTQEPRAHVLMISAQPIRCCGRSYNEPDVSCRRREGWMRSCAEKVNSFLVELLESLVPNTGS